MASEIIPFPVKPDSGDPMDGVEMCAITINGKGEVFMRINTYVETPEQFNWIIAKVGEAVGGIIADKNEVINAS